MLPARNAGLPCSKQARRCDGTAYYHPASPTWQRLMAYALGSRTAVQQDCLALILKMVGEYVHRRHCGPCTCTCRPTTACQHPLSKLVCLLSDLMAAAAQRTYSGCTSMRTAHDVYEVEWAADERVDRKDVQSRPYLDAVRNVVLILAAAPLLQTDARSA